MPMYIKDPNSTRASWHLFKTFTRVPGMSLTLCNRTLLNALERNDLPAEKTCETCFRISTAAS